MTTPLTLSDHQLFLLRYAVRRGQRWTERGRILDPDRVADGVSEVITPVIVEAYLSRVDLDDTAPLMEVWERIDTRVRERARTKVAEAVADLEAQGIPLGHDPDSIERALAAALELHSVNNNEEEQRA